MHHELLLALLGHTGDLIDAKPDGYFIRHDIAFISKAQQCSLDKLLKLGFYYSTLQTYVQTALDTSRTKTLGSVYAVGMSHGIHFYLDKYCHKILELEELMLQSKTVLPLPQMMSEMQEYMEIFSSLCKLLDKFWVRNSIATKTKCVCGSRLLEILHRMTISGYPNVRKCMLKLQQCCHRVLYKQIISWMLYGELIDPYNEFFVKPSALHSTKVTKTQEDALRMHMIDILSVPSSYFPLSIAENIYYIGNSMRILTMDMKDDNILSGKIFNDLSRDIAQTMAGLANEPSFNIMRVEHAVERIRSQVATQLYQKIVVEAQFLLTFDAIKDYFLLFRGEVFQSLMEKTLTAMSHKPTIKSQDDLNQNFLELLSENRDAERMTFPQNIRLHLPLQTFFFRGFTLTNGLIIEGLVKGPSAKYLCADEELCSQNQRFGLMYWTFQQFERYSCVTNVDILIPRSDELEDSQPWTSKLLVLIQNSSSYHFQLSKGFQNVFHIQSTEMLPASYQCLIIELDLLRPDRFASVLIVKPSLYLLKKDSCQLIPTSNESKSVHVAMHDTSEKSPLASIAIGYAPVKLKDNSSLTAPKKILYVTVNGIFIFETPLDLQDTLHLHPLYGEYWLGLGLGPILRVSKWTCDKYPERAARKPHEAIQTKNQPISSRELWNHLTLSCQIPWPISLLITSESLQSYNRLFQFCFRLKRLQYALECAWKNSFYSRMWSERYNQVAVCALQSRMLFVVKNVQLYFQISVINASFHKCREDIQVSNDFDQVKRLHEEYIASLTKRCFIYNKYFVVALDSILQLCWQFVDWILAEEQKRSQSATISIDVLQRLEKKFAEAFSYFCGLLQHTEEARELLFLLHFNEYSLAADQDRR